MIQEKITRTIFAVDVNGKVIPSTGLAAADIAFIDKDTSSEIRFSSFTENGNGSYTFDGFTEYNGSSWVALTTKHICNITIETVAQPQLGQVEIGADSLAYPVKTTETRSGVTTNIVDAGTRIIAKGVAGTASTDFVILSQLSGLASKTLPNTYGAKQTYAGGAEFTVNTPLGGDPLYPILAFEDYVIPPSDYCLTPKKYVIDLIAGAQLSAFPYDTRTRKIIKNATAEVTNKVYKTFLTARNSCGDPTADTRFKLIVESYLLSVSHAYLLDYIDLYGEHKENSIMLDVSTTIPTDKNVKFRNLTIFLGAGVIATDRVYANFDFEDCIIYAWKNTEFKAGRLVRCDVYHPATYKAKLSDGVLASGSTFNQYIDTVADPNYLGRIDEGIDPAFTMPADPTIST